MPFVSASFSTSRSMESENKINPGLKSHIRTSSVSNHDLVNSSDENRQYMLLKHLTNTFNSTDRYLADSDSDIFRYFTSNSGKYDL